MSKFHEDCTKSPEFKKALCDCKHCTSKDCPDILSGLAISVPEKSCGFGSKVGKKTAKREEPNPPQRSSLLDMLSPERDCPCGVMARAVRSNIHMNLGLTERRNAIKPEPSVTDEMPENK